MIFHICRIPHIMNTVDFYKCLADETRLNCLMLVAIEEELCVCELVSALKLSQPKISRHIAQLRETGLLADRRHGQWVFYRLHPTLPSWMQQIILSTMQHNRDQMQTALSTLALMGNRPNRQKMCC